MLIYASIDFDFEIYRGTYREEGWILRPQIFFHHNIIHKEFTQKIWGRSIQPFKKNENVRP